MVRDWRVAGPGHVGLCKAMLLKIWSKARPACKLFITALCETSKKVKNKYYKTL